MKKTFFPSNPVEISLHISFLSSLSPHHVFIPVEEKRLSQWNSVLISPSLSFVFSHPHYSDSLSLPSNTSVIGSNEFTDNENPINLSDEPIFTLIFHTFPPSLSSNNLCFYSLLSFYIFQSHHHQHPLIFLRNESESNQKRKLLRVEILFLSVNLLPVHPFFLSPLYLVSCFHSSLLSPGCVVNHLIKLPRFSFSPSLSFFPHPSFPSSSSSSLSKIHSDSTR